MSGIGFLVWALLGWIPTGILFWKEEMFQSGDLSWTLMSTVILILDGGIAGPVAGIMSTWILLRDHPMRSKRATR